MGFYNPLSEKPDILGGLNELLQLYAQMMMMKQFYGQGQQGQMGQQPGGGQMVPTQPQQQSTLPLMQLLQMMQGQQGQQRPNVPPTFGR